MLEAPALGARASLIGRPFLRGLAATGQAGVRDLAEVTTDAVRPRAR